MLPSRELAEIAVKALDSKKGKEIRLIRIDKITTLAEYFVICTGTSNTQINALCDAVEKELTEKGEEPLHREGYRGDTWVLLDYGCVVVHVFNDEARKFYSLEHLWADGEEVDLSAILPHAEEK
ncbi:ribosome silencing factor [Oscillibacter sp. ER4]|uniref:ribosome silencing factor n=1 Tax=Oscillibacter sp. ER4 TaxID=1519439 RepID=UPI00051B6AA7|nr:ribosome silencing factor [Oscillibacter sp. ER4]